MKVFLGTGLLGTGFIKAQLKKGNKISAWNRTYSKCEPLAAEGANCFENIQDAVREADRIHIIVKDDAAVNEVLAKAEPALKPGAVIIDHTTTSKEGAIERTEQWKAKGFFYQHAPVFMGPANALDCSGYMLVSGDQQLISSLQKELAEMTGQLLNLGEQSGKAAAMKLIGNSFLITFGAGIRDMLKLSNALDINLDDLNALFDQWNPGAQLLPRMNRMASGDYSSPSWELQMARKDTGLFIQAAENKNIQLAVLPAIASLMDSLIQKGHANDDWTVIAK